MKKLITAIFLTMALSFNVVANEQCGEEEKAIIAMQEKSLTHGAGKRSAFMAYTRITVGTAGMIYAVVNSTTGIGLLSFVIFLGGSLDIYINSNNVDEIEKLTERICTG